LLSHSGIAVALGKVKLELAWARIGCIMNAELFVTNLVRRPVDGQVITASGRLIPQPPWVTSDSPVSAAAYDQWLVEQGMKEAIETGESGILTRLMGVVAASVDAQLRHLLSDFLFGHSNPVFEARCGVDEPTEE